MAHSRTDFLMGRRLLLAAAPAFFAAPALARLGPELATGSLARFSFAKEPKPLGELAFTDADDKPLKLADYKGKTVLLNFWATWCAPCVKEMPSLDKLQAEMGKDKFVVLPLSLDGPTRRKVAPFYEEKKLANLGVYFDKGKKVMGALDISVLPTSVLVDAQGREIGRLEGEADWDKPEALALMKAATPSG
jgi:thiol-disulfide isomerase/thioredoxin